MAQRKEFDEIWTRVQWKMVMNRLLVKESQQIFDKERNWIKGKLGQKFPIRW